MMINMIMTVVAAMLVMIVMRILTMLMMIQVMMLMIMMIVMLTTSICMIIQQRWWWRYMPAMPALQSRPKARNLASQMHLSLTPRRCYAQLSLQVPITNQSLYALLFTPKWTISLSRVLALNAPFKLISIKTIAISPRHAGIVKVRKKGEKSFRWLCNMAPERAPVIKRRWGSSLIVYLFPTYLFLVYYTPISLIHAITPISPHLNSWKWNATHA